MPCFRAGRSFSIFGHNLLHLVKEIVRNNPGHTTGNFLVLIGVNTDVPLILKHFPQAVFIERNPTGCFISLCVECVTYFRDRLTACVHFKDFYHNRGGFFIHYEMLVRGNLEAQGDIAACAKALLSVYIHTPPDFLGKLCAVVFCHRFKQTLYKNTACVICDILTGRQYPDAVFLELCLVCCAVIAVTGEAVKLIDKHILEALFCAVLNHSQKVRACVSSAGDRTVNIFAYNGIAVFLCELITGF